MFLRFAYPELLYMLVPLFCAALAYRFLFYKTPVYAYPLAPNLLKTSLLKNSMHKKVLFILRLILLLGLMILIPRPQWVDERSKVNVDGIDIVIDLDLSGSMQAIDDLQDRRMRIDVAKEEAIRFIEKRSNDPIGIVIFAQDSLSRCPLTLDKKFLKNIVSSLNLGFIDPQGTALGTGLATAINRLKDSKAKSKIIILLTDGVPTPEKITPEEAIEMAKEFKIKIYTIGIGNKEGGYVQHPLMPGSLARMRTEFDPALLQKIADQTGGKYFHAQNQKDMRTIYDTINTLEKTKHETNIFHNYYEAFLSLLWIILLLFACELMLRLFIWRGV